MSIFVQAKSRVSRFLMAFFRKRRSRIGIYGPPNAGKTTLANRIARDWTGEMVGPVSEIPHETRRALRKQDITITGNNGSTITIDIVDTPGVTTKIDYKDFLEYGIGKDEAVIRAREATEGVAEAMHWLREDIDGVIYMLDCTEDPFLQVNIMMIGIIESRKLPVLIAANKIDLPDASPQRIRSAFPQHPVIAISCTEGKNIEELYEQMVYHFGWRMQQGVQIDLIAEERLSEMTSYEKIHMILDNVREGKIVILEKGLSPEEQSRLIEITMREILPDGFNGIEIETYPSRDDAPGFLQRLLGRASRESRLTVIGPANQLRMIRKDKDMISAWVSSR